MTDLILFIAGLGVGTVIVLVAMALRVRRASDRVESWEPIYDGLREEYERAGKRLPS